MPFHFILLTFLSRLFPNSCKNINIQLLIQVNFNLRPEITLVRVFSISPIERAPPYEISKTLIPFKLVASENLYVFGFLKNENMKPELDCGVLNVGTNRAKIYNKGDCRPFSTCLHYKTEDQCL